MSRICIHYPDEIFLISLSSNSNAIFKRILKLVLGGCKQVSINLRLAATFNLCNLSLTTTVGRMTRVGVAKTSRGSSCRKLGKL